MEKREDLQSILPFLPLFLRSSALFWPSQSLDAFKALALGPDVSRVDSGDVFFDAILDIRDSLGLSSQRLASRAADGFALFFNRLMPRTDSVVWFRDVVPELARLLMRLPSLLEAHYLKSDEISGQRKSGLRLMLPQEAGIVLLSQELIAALLACALFCLFPTCERGARNLPDINFDHLFASLHPNAKRSQEHKVKCLVHYFERICLNMSTGYVSFERKVLPFKDNNQDITYPDVSTWRNSSVPLCSFEIFSLGLIEDQQHDALEVDFANEYLGGGALNMGCVQEEIRFMINPELIIGMLFMTAMGDNEAIEIVGAERFSCYMGYASSFRFGGDYMDMKPFDSMGRRKTRIVAIDALFSPERRQYEAECLIRETNKALCGFLNLSKHQCYRKVFGGASLHKNDTHYNNIEIGEFSNEKAMSPGNSENGSTSQIEKTEISQSNSFQEIYTQENIGIATGNWGCGAFGGDPEIKSIIQWLAASQALRPFIHYYTFGEAALDRLEKLAHWILLHKWTVGDLWNILTEYSTQKLNRDTNLGFFDWILPDHSSKHDAHY